MPTVKPTKRPWIREKSKAEQNQSRGGNEETAKYRRKPWRTVRALKLQSSPLCEECLKEKKLVAATVVDHIKQVIKGGAFLDMENLQSLCVSHHSKKSQAESRQ